MRSYFKTPLSDRRSLFITEIEDQKPLVDPTMTIHSFILSLPGFLFTNSSSHLSLPTEPCMHFLKRLGEDLGLHVQVEYPVTQAKPIIILSMIGTQPELKSIILNSHMDVVPVFQEYWTHNPFDADLDDTGRIIARGAQDMKSVGMQYLGALRYFKRKQITFKRTIHVLFVPEEELGGDGGMADFVHQEAFRNLNAGFSLDEGKTALSNYQVFFIDMLSISFLHYRLVFDLFSALSTIEYLATHSRFHFLIRHRFSHRSIQCLLCRTLHLAHHFQDQRHNWPWLSFT